MNVIIELKSAIKEEFEAKIKLKIFQKLKEALINIIESNREL